MSGVVPVSLQDVLHGCKSEMRKQIKIFDFAGIFGIKGGIVSPFFGIERFMI